MERAKLEYVWLDSYKPTQSLRRKTKAKGWGALAGVMLFGPGKLW